MTNWHNEVFEEMGWLLDEEVKQPEIVRMFPEQAGSMACYCGEMIGCHVHTTDNLSKKSPNQCDFCGTRTGLHGFSFDKEGRY